MSLSRRVSVVRERMVRAASRVRRDPDSITLVAVSKTRRLEEILEAHKAGVVDFGENRVQEAAAKFAEGRPSGITLHMVGHLQSNKAQRAVELFDTVHSLDSIALAHRLGRLACGERKRLAVFVEVNLAGEATKHGASLAELDPLLDEVRSIQTLELRGLMIVPPFDPDPELSRPHFGHVRELARKKGLSDLSMGMSHDFEVAIEEGATHVRVGEAIFGPRSRPPE